MATQPLDKFRAIFSTDPVRIEYKEFAKDGFTANDIKALKAEGLDAIFLKPLSSAERADLEASVAGFDGKKDVHNLYARFVAPCWVEDENGKNLGTAKEIGQLRADLVAAIFKKVSELNGMGAAGVEEAGKT